MTSRDRQLAMFPHGIYDVGLNRGHINLGTSHETSQFACESIERWWQQHGRGQYPQASKLMLLCDGGGSNSARRYVFKEELRGLPDQPDQEAGKSGPAAVVQPS